MFGSINRETLTLAAIVVALASVFYLYKELKKTNNDIQSCKTFSQALAQQLTHTPVHDTKPAKQVSFQRPVATSAPAPAPAPAAEAADEESEDEVDN